MMTVQELRERIAELTPQDGDGIGEGFGKMRDAWVLLMNETVDRLDKLDQVIDKLSG